MSASKMRPRINSSVGLTALIFLSLGSGSLPTWASDSDIAGWEMLHPFKDPLGAAPPQLTRTLDSPIRIPGQSSNMSESCATEGVAKEPPPPYLQTGPMSLSTAIDIALCRNAQIRGTWSAIRQQVGEVGQAKAAYLPQANAAISRLDDRVQYPGSALPTSQQRSNRASVTVNWRVWDAGTRDANLDAASAQLRAAIATQDATVLQLTVQIVQSYFDVQQAQAIESRKHKHRDLLKEIQKSVQRRLTLGVGSQSELSQATAALATAELDISRIEGQNSELQATFAYQLGLPASTPLQVAELEEIGAEIGSATEAVNIELDSWLEEMRLSHPAIAAAQAQWMAALAKVRAVQGEGSPSLDINLGYYDNGRPTQGLASYRSRERLVGVTLNIPLFDGFGHTYRVHAARAVAEERHMQYADVSASTMQSLVKIHARAKASWRNVKASKENYDANNAYAQSQGRLFENGGTDLKGLLQSKLDESRAAEEYITSLSKWQFSIVEISMLQPRPVEDIRF